MLEIGVECFETADLPDLADFCETALLLDRADMAECDDTLKLSFEVDMLLVFGCR